MSTILIKIPIVLPPWDKQADFEVYVKNKQAKIARKALEKKNAVMEECPIRYQYSIKI